MIHCVITVLKLFIFPTLIKWYCSMSKPTMCLGFPALSISNSGWPTPNQRHIHMSHPYHSARGKSSGCGSGAPRRLIDQSKSLPGMRRTGVGWGGVVWGGYVCGGANQIHYAWQSEHLRLGLAQDILPGDYSSTALTTDLKGTASGRWHKPKMFLWVTTTAVTSLKFIDKVYKLKTKMFTDRLGNSNRNSHCL